MSEEQDTDFWRLKAIPKQDGMLYVMTREEVVVCAAELHPSGSAEISSRRIATANRRARRITRSSSTGGSKCWPLSQRLIALREGLGLTRAAAIRLTGVANLYKYESGEKHPTQGVLERFAAAYGVLPEAIGEPFCWDEHGRRHAETMAQRGPWCSYCCRYEMPCPNGCGGRYCACESGHDCVPA